MKKNLLFWICGVVALSTFSCNEDQKKKDDPIIEPIVTEGFVVQTSKPYLLSDGKDQITFTVYENGADVTDRSTIFLRSGGDNQPLSKPQYTTSEPATLTFLAKQNDKTSESITIEALSSVQNTPEDPKPAQFSEFYKRVLAMQITGTWCPQCPKMIKAIHDYEAKYSNGDVIFGAAHGGATNEPLLNEGSQTLLSWSGVGSYPFMIFNFSKLAEHQTGTGVTIEKMKSIVDKTLAIDAKSAVSVVATEQAGKINVRADVKIAVEGEYRVSCWLLEDDIYAPQENSTDISGEFIDNHKHVIRAIYPAKVAYGALGGKYAHAAGSSYTFCASFDVVEAKIANISKAQVAIIVYDKNAKICDNVVKCAIGSSAAYSYK